MMNWRRFGMLVAAGLTIAMAAPAFASAHQLAAPAATAPAGYKIVRDTQFSAAPGMFDAGGQVSCPTGTVVWGGGVGNDFQNGTINTSGFVGSVGWHARVNNNAGSTEGFEIDAICAKKPSLYKTVNHQIDDPAGTQKSGSATCPTGTVLLSGSVLSDGDTTNVYLTSAWPNGQHKFTADQENGSSMDEPFTVSAICAKKPAGYSIVKVTQTAGSGGGIVVPESYCASARSVIGGGILVSTPSPAADISMSLVGSGTTNAWLGVVQNTGTTSVNVTASVICAS
jgi:hypothetical protein